MGDPGPDGLSEGRQKRKAAKKVDDPLRPRGVFSRPKKKRGLPALKKRIVEGHWAGKSRGLLRKWVSGTNGKEARGLWAFHSGTDTEN